MYATPCLCAHQNLLFQSYIHLNSFSAQLYQHIATMHEHYNCDQIYENGSKLYMYLGVFLSVFKDISIYAYLFSSEYFLCILKNFSYEFYTVL